MPSMDTPRLLNSQENKLLNQIVSVLRPETATHTKENNTISVTSAQVGAIGVAIAEYAANAGKSVKRDRVRSDDARGPERYNMDYVYYQQMIDHNVSDALAATAAFDSPAPLADAQVAAVIAAGEAPSPPAFDGHAVETDRHQLDNILKAAYADLSLDDIHNLFHSEDGKPIHPSDKIVDDYIRAVHDIVALDEHAAAAGKLVKRDQVGSDDAPGSKPYHDTYQRYRQEAERNVSKNSTTAAASDHQPTLPIDAELEAMGALLQAPSPTFDVHVGDIELHDVGDIIGAMSAGKSLDEIHQAFHSKDGKPVYLTDDEVDSAIGGYYMDASSDIGAQWV